MNYHQDILDTIEEAISFVGKDYKYIYVNNAYCRFFDKKPSDLVGRSMSEFFDTDHFNKKIKPYFDLCLKGEHVKFEDVTAFKNGRGNKYMLMDYYPHYNDKNEIDGLVASARERTEEPALSENRFGAKDAVAETEERLKEIFNSTTEAIVIHDDQSGRILDCNEATLKMYGYESKDQMLKLSVGDVSDVEKGFGLEQIAVHIEEVVRSGSHTFEWLAKKKNGDCFWVEVNLKRTIIGGEGRLLAVARDIDERKKSIQALKESEEKFRTFVENANDIIYQLNPDGIFTYASPNWTEILGYKLEEVIGETFKKFVHPDDVKLCKDFLDKILSSGEKQSGVEYRVKHKGGSWRWHVSNGSPIKDPNGISISYMGIARDITERKKVQDELQESEHRFKLMMDATNDGLWDWKFITNEIYFSPGWKKMLGYRDDELENDFSVWKKLTHPDDVKHTMQVFHEFKEGERDSFEVENRMKHKDGRWIFVLARASLVRDNQNKAYRLIGSHVNITRLKSTEEDLLFQKTLFNNVLDAIPDMISIHDSELNIIYSNWKGFAAVKEDLRQTGSKCYKTYRNYDDVCPDCQAKNVLQTKEAFQSEAELPDGRWVDLRVIPIYNEKGVVDKFVEWVRDVSELKRSEVLLKEKNKELSHANKQLKEAKEISEQNEAKFKSYIENAPDGVFITNKKGEYIEVNTAACRITGYTKDELLNMSVQDLLPKDNIREGQEHFQRLLKFGHSKGIVGYRTKKGEHRFWSVDAVKLSENRFLGFTKDLTAQILAQEDTRLLAEMLNTAPNSITVHDEKGSFLYANKKTFELHGYTEEEFMSLSLDKLDVPESARYIEQRIKDIKEKGYAVFEVEHFKKDGSKIPLEIYAKLVNWKGIPALLSIATDISERKKWIGELIIAKEKAEEANRLKTEFLNNMSHEIRTPMNGIIGFSEMLNRTNITDEKRDYYARIVRNSSKQLLRIIDDILEISTLETKQEKINETEFCLNDLILELFSVFSLKSKERNIPIYIKKELSDNQSCVITDKTKLSKILSNLLENALKFTNEGFIEFGYRIEKDKIVLFVKDTGIGISPENHQFIFERFAQAEKGLSRKHGGLGLGLSISKENAQLLGGNITLKSEKGKGAAFYVSIPYRPALKKAEESSGNHSENTSTSADKNYTILIAEDEEVNYLYFEELFEDQTDPEYTLIHAKNGKEAVDICMENNNIDIILMDIKMPVMNGYEATKKIKSKFPHIPVIAQTAYSTKSDKELAIRHGCDDFISKPISKEELITLMKKYLKAG